eukprot:g26660.t1
MTDHEKRKWHSIGVERDPVEDITAALRKASEEGLTEAEFGKVREVTVPKLKAYCKAKGLAVGGKKADLLSCIWEHAATQVEAQEEEESELDSQADDKVAEVLEGNALAGQSDLELSVSLFAPLDLAVVALLVSVAAVVPVAVLVATALAVAAMVHVAFLVATGLAIAAVEGFDTYRRFFATYFVYAPDLPFLFQPLTA